MAIVKNYCFGGRDDHDLISGLMDYRSARPRTYILSGNIYSDERFADGTRINTSGIKELVVDSFAKTLSGTEYSIADIHPDYQNFLNAIDKNIPILTNWVIKGSLRQGYKIYGNINNKSFHLDILSQDEENNLLTVIDSEGGKKFSIFVDWTTIPQEYLHAIISLKKYHLDETDLYFNKDFEYFCGRGHCRPILFPSK